jgi:Spy/CpxP family protein refolding chaperone
MLPTPKKSPPGALSPREKEKRTMHPGMVSWWHAQRAGMSSPYSCGGGGPPWGGGGGGGDYGEGGGGYGDGGGGFGVRRPLRFLAYKLELDERQVAELARVLNELKTERAQAEVDRRRTVAALADAVAGSAFDGAKAQEGGALRVSSAERLRDAVLKALQQIHGLLDDDQRKRLAYLIRTGTLAI